MKFSENSKVRIVFFDEAVAFGGSVVVLSHLFKYIDRSKYTPLLVSGLDRGSLNALFKAEDILCQFRLRLDYSDRARWMERLEGSSQLVRRIGGYLFTLAAYVANVPKYLRLIRELKRVDPHIIHVNNGREGLLMARLLRARTVWHLHGMFDDFLDGTFGMGGRTSAFISISKYISEAAVKAVREHWLERFGLPPDAVVFAHVGRIVRWKGQLEFLRAFAEVVKQDPRAYALIVGDDVEGLSAEYPRMLRASAQELGISERVVFTGHVDKPVELMSVVDVVVHSSIEPEPFGLVITEAMSAGTAVIAARLGAPMEIIEDGVNGLLVNPEDPAEFAAGLTRLLSDETYRRRLANEGRRTVVERYSPETFAQRVEAVYARALADAKPLAVSTSLNPQSSQSDLNR
jgi:glycosyltransferase involved in cell wall biosynthesis